MLRHLSADYEEFKSVNFRPGLNLVVAKKTQTSRSTDSRNGSGKSSLIELLHFLLGARSDNRSLLAKKDIRKVTFTLEMDWPSIDGPLSVSRRGHDAKVVTLSPSDVTVQSLAPVVEQIQPMPLGFDDLDWEDDEWGWDGLGGPIPSAPVAPRAVSTRTVELAEWQRLIERDLFQLPDTHPGVSGRQLLSFLIRRVGDHGFNEAVRSFSRQPESQSTPNIAYLLGLDSTLAARYQELAAKRATRDQLKKAVNDPIWGRVVGNKADLRGEMSVLGRKITELKRQLESFRVVPQYEELTERANELTRRIQELSTSDLIFQRNLDHLDRAVAETVDPEVRYLPQVYEQLGVAVPDATLRRFDEVKEFHAAVVRNRHTYLQAEIDTTRGSLAQHREERARLDEERSRILTELNNGGALEVLTMIQKALAQEEANYGALANRLEAAESVENSSQEIEAARVELKREIQIDLNERQPQIERATLLFYDLVSRLYGAERRAYLSVEPGPSSLKVIPKIDSDASQGINKMAIYCFDLTMAVIAHRDGRGPDFLVHDSHIFDGVDDRQLARALQIAAELADSEGMQHIVTINEDDLLKAQRLNFDAESYVIEPRLTDSTADGGLFGFRFDR